MAASLRKLSWLAPMDAAPDVPRARERAAVVGVRRQPDQGGHPSVLPSSGSEASIVRLVTGPTPGMPAAARRARATPGWP